jgi:hypothetical protein
VYGGSIGGPGPAHAASCLSARRPAFRIGPAAVYKPPSG